MASTNFHISLAGDNPSKVEVEVDIGLCEKLMKELMTNGLKIDASRSNSLNQDNDGACAFPTAGSSETPSKQQTTCSPCCSCSCECYSKKGYVTRIKVEEQTETKELTDDFVLENVISEASHLQSVATDNAEVSNNENKAIDHVEESTHAQREDAQEAAHRDDENEETRHENSNESASANGQSEDADNEETRDENSSETRIDDTDEAPAEQIELSAQHGKGQNITGHQSSLVGENGSRHSQLGAADVRPKDSDHVQNGAELQPSRRKTTQSYQTAAAAEAITDDTDRAHSAPEVSTTAPEPEPLRPYSSLGDRSQNQPPRRVSLQSAGGNQPYYLGLPYFAARQQRHLHSLPPPLDAEYCPQHTVLQHTVSRSANPRQSDTFSRNNSAPMSLPATACIVEPPRVVEPPLHHLYDLQRKNGNIRPPPIRPTKVTLDAIRNAPLSAYKSCAGMAPQCASVAPNATRDVNTTTGQGLRQSINRDALLAAVRTGLFSANHSVSSPLQSRSPPSEDVIEEDVEEASSDTEGDGGESDNAVFIVRGTAAAAAAPAPTPARERETRSQLTGNQLTTGASNSTSSSQHQVWPLSTNPSNDRRTVRGSLGTSNTIVPTSAVSSVAPEEVSSRQNESRPSALSNQATSTEPSTARPSRQSLLASGSSRSRESEGQRSRSSDSSPGQPQRRMLKARRNRGGNNRQNRSESATSSGVQNGSAGRSDVNTSHGASDSARAGNQTGSTGNQNRSDVNTVPAASTRSGNQTGNARTGSQNNDISARIRAGARSDDEDRSSDNSSPGAEMIRHNQEMLRRLAIVEEDSAEVDPEAIKTENRKLKESRLCKVCRDKDSNRLFLPCAHLASCSLCSPALTHCPQCKATIRGIVSVYFG